MGDGLAARAPAADKTKKNRASNRVLIREHRRKMAREPTEKRSSHKTSWEETADLSIAVSFLLICDLRLVFLPGAKILNRELRQQTHHRQLTFAGRHTQLLIDKVVVKANRSSIMTGVAIKYGVQPNPVDRAQTHGAGLAAGVQHAT